MTDQPEPRSQEAEVSNGGVHLPAWVAIAFGLVAILVFGVVFSQVAAPLSDLILGDNAEPPVPSGVDLISESDDSNYATREWQYATDKSGCEIARFYAIEHDAECVFSPFVCDEQFNQVERDEPDGFFNVATCTRTVSDRVGGYSWQVIIASNYQDGPFTRFRVYLFDE